MRTRDSPKEEVCTADFARVYTTSPGHAISAARQPPVMHFNEISDLKPSLEKNPGAALTRHEQASKGTSLSALSSSLACIPSVAGAPMQRQLFLHITNPCAINFLRTILV